MSLMDIRRVGDLDDGILQAWITMRARNSQMDDEKRGRRWRWRGVV